MEICKKTQIAYTSEITNGFNEFVKAMKKMPVGITVTIENAIPLLWADLDAGNKIKLGKMIMASIRCKNLTGIKANDSMPGKAQTFKRIGVVKVYSIFSAEYYGNYNSVSEFIENNKELEEYMFIKCYFKTLSNGDTELNVKYLDKDGNDLAEEETRTITKEYFATHCLAGENNEFKAILALWYAFDRVFETSKELINSLGIKNVCFLAPNDQIVKRICGEKFDTSTNKYKYTEFIQEKFSDFKPGELRELPFEKVGIVSLLNSNLKK